MWIEFIQSNSKSYAKKHFQNVLIVFFLMIQIFIQIGQQLPLLVGEHESSAEIPTMFFDYLKKANIL